MKRKRDIGRMSSARQRALELAIQVDASIRYNKMNPRVLILERARKYLNFLTGGR
jgi:hypothetical protein